MSSKREKAPSNEVMLAIETSQRLGSIAIGLPDGRVIGRLMERAQPVDEWLMPSIDAALREAGLTCRAIDLVAVSIGPGGFSGLRVAISTVKGMSEALGVRVVPVPSALVAGEAYQAVGRVHVALACKRGTWWGTALHAVDGVWAIDGEAGLMDGARLDVAGVDAVIGDDHLPSEVRELGVEVRDLRLDGEGCLAVGRRLAARGGTVEGFAIGPLYPRPPEAVRKWSGR